jgi:hypothetical protein
MWNRSSRAAAAAAPAPAGDARRTGAEELLLRDPAGLLGRVPELRALAAHSRALRKAIEAGRPLAAYRALFWLRFRSGHAADRAVVTSLLARRRLFVTPITRAPDLSTVNGVGTRLHGSGDHDAHDGTYLTTLYIVAFFVPIYPLRSYLVRDSPQNRGRAWSFLGRVPLAAGAYLWQRVLATGLLVAVVAGAVSTVVKATHADVAVLNGLPVDIIARIDDSAPVAVPKNEGVRTIRAGTGRHTITIEAAGRIIEQQPIDVPSRTDVVAWNVFGASPVFAWTDVYRRRGEDSAHAEPAPMHYGCGVELFLERDVDYPFQAPPSEIKRDSDDHVIYKRVVSVAPGGAGRCVDYLLGERRVAEAATLESAVARVSGFEVQATGRAVHLLISAGDDKGAVALAADAVAAHPALVECHLLYQEAMAAHGQAGAVLAEYKARAERAPDSADAAYLYARLLGGEPAHAALVALAARYPSHAFIVHDFAYEQMVAGDYAGAASSYARLRQLDPPRWAPVVRFHARALVGAHRFDEAGRLLDEELRRPGRDDVDWDVARDRLLVAALAPGNPEAELAALPRPRDERDAALFRAELRLYTGLPLENDDLAVFEGPMRDTARIVLAARSDPAQALALLESVPDEAVPDPDDDVGLLLLAEALRDPRHAAAVAKLDRRRRSFRKDAIADYLTSGREDALVRLEPACRAIAHFVRSRTPGRSPAERKALLTKARAEDLLHGATTIAIASWKP